MIARINGLRWRIARLLAPDPILARPLGDGEAYLLIRGTPDYELYVWVSIKTLDMSLESNIRPLGDPYGLGNWEPSEKGTFSGTIG